MTARAREAVAEHRPKPSGMSIAGGHNPMAGFRGDPATYPFLRRPGTY